MSNAVRYQLLDHATDESPLWDSKSPINTHTAGGHVIRRHEPRSPAELRPELERLLRVGHIEIYEMTDPGNRPLGLEEALAVIGVDENWFSPLELGINKRRETIYALFLTDSGIQEFRREYAAANPEVQLPESWTTRP